jgi:hypothetical protein
MSHFDPTNMTREQREAWNQRVPTVTVRDPCPVCSTLQPGVKERTGPWPNYFKLTSCQSCFDAEHEKRKTSGGNKDPYFANGCY